MDKQHKISILKGYIEDCNKCDISKIVTNKVAGKGSLNASILVIGIGPGCQEDIEGECFVGPSGKLLTDSLENIGFDIEDIYFTNLVSCRPTSDTIKDRDPTQSEITNCKLRLWTEIKTISPKYIIALGELVSQTLLKTEEGIGRLIGSVHDRVWPEIEQIKIFCVYHPSFVLRKPKSKDIWTEQLRSIYDIINKRTNS